MSQIRKANPMATRARQVLLHSLLILAGVMHVVGAAPPKELNGFDLTGCTIPAEDIHRGGPPRDGIPALTDPKTTAAGNASYLAPNDMWNSNVLLYDRQETGQSSLWSQAAMRAVCGPAARKELKLRLLSSQLLSWKKWKNRYPDTTVLSRHTGHRRDYDRNPYENYFFTQRLMFPVSASAEEREDYPNKEHVVVVRVGNRIKGYPISEIAEAAKGEGIVTDTLAAVGIRLHYDSTEETVRVTPAGRVPQEKSFVVAHMFWFAWKSVYPDAPIFRAG
jgi:hypothetical protein